MLELRIETHKRKAWALFDLLSLIRGIMSVVIFAFGPLVAVFTGPNKKNLNSSINSPFHISVFHISPIVLYVDIKLIHFIFSLEFFHCSRPGTITHKLQSLFQLNQKYFTSLSVMSRVKVGMYYLHQSK